MIERLRRIVRRIKEVSMLWPVLSGCIAGMLVRKIVPLSFDETGKIILCSIVSSFVAALTAKNEIINRAKDIVAEEIAESREKPSV